VLIYAVNSDMCILGIHMLKQYFLCQYGIPSHFHTAGLTHVASVLVLDTGIFLFV